MVVQYGPFVEDHLTRINNDFIELAKGTTFEGISITYKARRGGRTCNTCGYKRNFLHTWESCANCGSPAICVDYDPTKQLQIIAVNYAE